jgi:hypothetical protein
MTSEKQQPAEISEKSAFENAHSLINTQKEQLESSGRSAASQKAIEAFK